MEIWDAYNQNFEKIPGMTLVRGEHRPDGIYHLVCDIIVRHQDGEYLLMQRSLKKKNFPGMWEATAGGSALQGEEPLACAMRELREETGIMTDSLLEVGRVVDPETKSCYVEYLCQTDWNKENITLQEGETDAFRWVSRETLLSMNAAELVTRRMQMYVDELKKPENESPITIRPATSEDLPEILSIYAYAREQMKKNGNPTQWGDNRPAQSLIEGDIEKKQSYVMCHDGKICGVFAFIIGEDPTYLNIEGGSWLNSEPYGTIHRVASNGSFRGIMDAALDFCYGLIDNIRVDTHADNIIMQKVMEKHHFTKCGIIYVDDGTPRLAFHKVVRG